MPYITYLFFIDNLRFLTIDQIVSKIAITLEKVGQIALKWRVNNAVIYKINKTQAILFSKARQQKLTKLLETRVKINRKTVYFKKKATQLLGVWLNSKLNFTFYVNKTLKKVKTAEIQIISLSKIYGLYLRMV